jgi:adenine/guanine phosphoribosyltransferase-like PRPP-binding protein
MKGNLFQRVAATGRTKGLITWPAGSSGTVNYLSLTDFVNATRQGDPGVDYVGGIDQNGLSPAAIVAQAAAEAAVVPAAISAKTGVKAGTVGANHK